jgi:putative transposase
VKRLKVYKTLKIPISGDDEKFTELQSMWYKLLSDTIKSTVKLGSPKQLDIQNVLYSGLREYTKREWNLYSYYLPIVFKTASETVKSCLESSKSNCRTRFPTVKETTPIVLTAQVCKIYMEQSLYAQISYQPNNPIHVKLQPSKEHEALLKETIEGKNNLRIHGLKLLKRADKWWLYISLEKYINLPQWELCKTAIGVDMGMNYIAVATPVDENKIHCPLFIKGRLWKHLQLQKRAKIGKMQSKGAYTKEKWDYYNRRLDEILHITAKKIVDYAKQFPKPIIIMEHLEGFKANSYSHKWNFLLSNWMRRRLQKYIEYKAIWEGIPVYYVSAYYTSKICCYCGNGGIRNGLEFNCPSCGRKLNADFSASVNIALQFLSKFVDKNIRHSLATKRISKSLNTLTKGGASIPRNNLQPDMTNEMKMMKNTESEFV